MTESQSSLAQQSIKPSLLRRLLYSQEPSVARSTRYVRVLNTTRQTEIGYRVEVADTAARRNKGLLGLSGLERGEGLWIVPCEAVHTFAMRFALDLIYIDRKHRVVKVRESVRPGRISGALRAHSVIELPAGTIATSLTAVGDVIEFESVSRSS